MENKTTYLLLLESEDSILQLQVTALNCFYGGEVRAYSDAKEAIRCLKDNGVPEIVIIDSKIITANDSEFYLHLESEEIAVPLIVTAAPPIDDKLMSHYPSITAVIEKPLSTNSFTYLIKSITTVTPKVPTHIPIKIPVLLRMGMGHFDLYLKLSETNFVKILHKGEPFFDSDAEKLSQKGIDELFIKKDDSAEFLKLLENEMAGIETHSLDDVCLTLQNLEAFEKVAKRLGWTPAVLISAQKSVTHALKILSKNQDILKVLKRRLKGPESNYTRHMSLLTYLVCSFCSSLGWIGESGQTKLALAALMHDMAVDDFYYDDIMEWNRRAGDFSDKSPETIKYRMHPFEASKMARSIDSLSPDVDQIILQHHELKTGKGFPRGIDSTRIGHLPALFIIVESLVEFIDDGENIETSITDFITWGREYYDCGHFKKVFSVFDQKLKS